MAKEKNNKKPNQYLVLENAILMSADIFAKLHEMRGEKNVCETARIIADEAMKLERKLDGLDPESFDYFQELEKHEQWVLEKWSPDN